MTFVVAGGAEMRAALRRSVVEVEAATRTATAQAAQLVKNEMQKQLRLTTHPKGTPTPSAPGEPPALVTGQLRRSIRVQTLKIAPGVYQAKIGPTTVYGRVQELGGATGRGGRTNLPARPYVKPTEAAMVGSDRLAAFFRDKWRAAMGL